MIDFNKPVQTRDGRKVRILCTDRASDHSVVGLVMNHIHGKEELLSWDCEGYRRQYQPEPGDLVNVPERLERILCVDSMNSLLIQFHPGSVPSKMCPNIRITYEDGKPVAVALEDCK